MTDEPVKKKRKMVEGRHGDKGEERKTRQLGSGISIFRQFVTYHIYQDIHRVKKARALSRVKIKCSEDKQVGDTSKRNLFGGRIFNYVKHYVASRWKTTKSLSSPTFAVKSFGLPKLCMIFYSQIEIVKTIFPFGTALKYLTCMVQPMSKLRAKLEAVTSCIFFNIDKVLNCNSLKCHSATLAHRRRAMRL
ncbi:hypothetical protein RUM44_000584 [Polyplax serrata]|uniref:Uncharacterized protein n=1 Tax=Polyplax serrata TaxID=468196 RepID=A0ABR1B5V5_POLSC